MGVENDLCWMKSSFSNAIECVEVGKDDERVLVRDSKDPDGARLSFTPSEWSAFLAGAKAGEFDHLA